MQEKLPLSHSDAMVRFPCLLEPMFFGGFYTAPKLNWLIFLSATVGWGCGGVVVLPFYDYMQMRLSAGLHGLLPCFAWLQSLRVGAMIISPIPLPQMWHGEEEWLYEVHSASESNGSGKSLH